MKLGSNLVEERGVRLCGRLSIWGKIKVIGHDIGGGMITLLSKGCRLSSLTLLACTSKCAASWHTSWEVLIGYGRRRRQSRRLTRISRLGPAINIQYSTCTCYSNDNLVLCRDHVLHKEKADHIALSAHIVEPMKNNKTTNWERKSCLLKSIETLAIIQPMQTAAVSFVRNNIYKQDLVSPLSPAQD